MKHALFLSTLLLPTALILAGPAAAEEISIPLSVEAWADTRLAFKDYKWNSKLAGPEHKSDVYVRYAGVAFHTHRSSYLEAYLLLLFEEFFAEPEGDELSMDQAWLKLSKNGFFIRLGKMNYAFGHETTFAIEDPLTWYFSDCRKTGVEVGYDGPLFFFSAAAFAGDFDTVNKKGEPEDERIDDYVLHIHVHPFPADSRFQLEAGMGYISDITETEMDFGNNYFFPGSFYRSPVPAASVYLAGSAELHPDYDLAWDFEFIQSEEFSEKNYLNLDGEKTRIGSANAELALDFLERYRAGVQYAMMAGFDWLKAADKDPSLTPTRFESLGIFGSFFLSEHLTLAAQFVSGRDDAGDRVSETYFQVMASF